jgi:hypothetical protein
VRQSQKLAVSAKDGHRSLNQVTIHSRRDREQQLEGAE